MTKLKISIPSIEAVKSFVTSANKYNCHSIVRSGRYIVDAKSILGVFSLDVSKPLELDLEVGENGIDDREDFITDIRSFLVNE